MVPGSPVEIETLQPPQDYSLAQIQHACAIAHFLSCATLVLAEPPANSSDTPGR